MKQWLDRFLREKGVDLNGVITVEGASGTNVMQLATVVEHIRIAPKQEQAAIKSMLVKLDFHNAAIEPFLEHLAQAIAQ